MISRSSTTIALAGVALGAGLIGFACGQAMSRTQHSRPAPPRSTVDDGKGFLARAARSMAELGGLAYGMGGLAGNSGEPGEASYGGASYGGARYGNYRFHWPGLPAKRTLLPPGRSHAPEYRAIPVAAAGSITGQVMWPRPPSLPATLAFPVKECPPTLPSNTLERDEPRHVAGALVYLEAIERGRAGLVSPALRTLDLQTGGTLREEECQFVPKLQIVSPIGATLFLQGGSRTARSWIGTLGRKEIFRMRMIQGSRERVVLGQAGFVEVRNEETAATAWVVVASHPYFALTGADGRFRLDEVPPGSYTLVAWHPPVAYQPAGARAERTPVLTPALVVKRRVRVRANRTIEIILRLPAI